jgi:hypothetical protein
MIGKRNGLPLMAVMPMIVSLLGGCASTPEPAVSAAPVVAAPAPVVTNPVVVAPPAVAAAPVVVAPAAVAAAPVVVTQPPAVTYPKVLTYPEGRYQLAGDATSGYYWVWIPAGSTVLPPPAPPALPTVSQSPPGAVVLTQVPREVTYPNGRYQLYGDATTGMDPSRVHASGAAAAMAGQPDSESVRGVGSVV